MPDISSRGVLILISLVGGHEHGYAMIKDINDYAGIKLGPGTLYGALDDLEQDGLIEPLKPVGRRKPYKITAAGSLALEAQLTTTAALARVGLGRLKTYGGR